MLQKLPIIYITPFPLEITMTIKGTVYASFSFISLNLSIILILRMQWRQRVKIKCNHLQGVPKNKLSECCWSHSALAQSPFSPTALNLGYVFVLLVFFLEPLYK